MKIQLKNLQDQTIVITGASSGIGLKTARMAAQRGARVVAAARQEDAIHQLEQELNQSGENRAAGVAADVAREEDVRRIAQTAVERFGGIDTWVNNAGTSIYGRIMDVPVEEERKLFDVNYWGVVYGCRAAVEHMRERGGAIINLGSVASDRAIPLQASYSATKHAVKAFTDSLRVEMDEANIPISVTLIKPTAIATPFFEHAENYMEARPTEPPPMYAPEIAAEAILYAATHPTRDLFVGDTAPLHAAMGRLMPGLGDKFMKAQLFKGQKSAREGRPGDNRALHEPTGTLDERGEYEVQVFEMSPYTKIKTHPKLTAAIAAGAAALTVGATIYGKRRSHHRGRW